MTLKPGVKWFGLTVVLLCLGLVWWGGLARPVHAETPASLAAGVAGGLPGGAQLTTTMAYTGYLPIVIGGQPQPPQPLSPAEQLIALINAERARHGLPPLIIHAILTRVAQAHSQDMAARDFYSHTNPDGLDPCQRMTRAGYDWWACGENIGAGFPTPELMLMIWLTSGGHRANILSPYFTDVGVGYVQGGAYGHYWTIDFGAPR